MRTFIAVDVVSRNTIGMLQQEIMAASRLSPREIKPVEPHNFHFTLIFLGEINEQQADGIKIKMQELQFEPFTITYTGVGAFPRPNAAKVMWVGVDPAGGRRLVALANSVVEKVAELGFRADKPFSPHMTIFRVRNNNRPLKIADIAEKYDGKTFGSDTIDSVHLKKSDLTPSGPIYSNIYTKKATRESAG